MAYYSAASYLDPRNEPHFLESCSLCGKPLGCNDDIFMYRGNTPFCSKECREEQIEFDAAKEKNGKRSSSSSSSSSRGSIGKADPKNETVRTGAVAVA